MKHSSFVLRRLNRLSCFHANVCYQRLKCSCARAMSFGTMVHPYENWGLRECGMSHLPLTLTDGMQGSGTVLGHHSNVPWTRVELEHMLQAMGGFCSHTFAAADAGVDMPSRMHDVHRGSLRMRHYADTRPPPAEKRDLPRFGSTASPKAVMRGCSSIDLFSATWFLTSFLVRTMCSF